VELRIWQATGTCTRRENAGLVTENVDESFCLELSSQVCPAI
jgi:hypothetical protein